MYKEYIRCKFFKDRSNSFVLRQLAYKNRLQTDRETHHSGVTSGWPGWWLPPVKILVCNVNAHAFATDRNDFFYQFCVQFWSLRLKTSKLTAYDKFIVTFLSSNTDESMASHPI